jgi:hypothetical protein
MIYHIFGRTQRCVRQTAPSDGDDGTTPSSGDAPASDETEFVAGSTATRGAGSALAVLVAAVVGVVVFVAWRRRDYL